MPSNGERIVVLRNQLKIINLDIRHLKEKVFSIISFKAYCSVIFRKNIKDNCHTINLKYVNI